MCLLWPAICAVLFLSCAGSSLPVKPKLSIAAAANLTSVFDEIGKLFREQSGIDVVFSYGSTAQLAQQIENGAPFDLFAAADTEHVDRLIGKGRLLAKSRAVYAQGQLALWIPTGGKLGVRDIRDLAGQNVRFIAVAQPSLAPYGEAAVETMKATGLWETLQPKLVYANNVNAARQYAATGNADAAFTAYSLVLKESGIIVKVDPKLYSAIDQALGIVTSSQQAEQAAQFSKFLLGSAGQAILVKGGYLPAKSK